MKTNKFHLLHVSLSLFYFNIFNSDILSNDDPYKHGQNLMYSYRFQEAISIYDSLINVNPNDPKAYIFKASILWWKWIADPSNDSFKKNFYEAINISLDVSELYLKTNPDEPDALLYIAGVYGYIGRYHLQNKSWMKAYWYGRKGKNILDQIISKNINNYDAYCQNSSQFPSGRSS